MLSKCFVPPLQTQLDGTTLKSAPNSRQKSIFPTYRSIQRLERPKEARGYLSPKIGDRWRLSHSPKASNTPTTSWANSHELGQLTTRARGTGVYKGVHVFLV